MINKFTQVPGYTLGRFTSAFCRRDSPLVVSKSCGGRRFSAPQPWSISTPTRAHATADTTSTPPVATLIHQRTTLKHYLLAEQTRTFGRYDPSNAMSSAIFLSAEQGFLPTHAVLDSDAYGNVCVRNATDVTGAVQVVANLPGFSSRKLADGDDIVCRSLSPLGAYADVYTFVREQQLDNPISNARVAVPAISYAPTANTRALTSIPVSTLSLQRLYLARFFSYNYVLTNNKQGTNLECTEVK